MPMKFQNVPYNTNDIFTKYFCKCSNVFVNHISQCFDEYKFLFKVYELFEIHMYIHGTINEYKCIYICV